eukprot:Gb_12662 [translate_table: standard]
MESIWKWSSVSLFFGLLLWSNSAVGSSDNLIYALCNVNKYENGTEYERNINTVLQYLVNGAANNGGFSTYSYGKDSDKINGLLQCRGDVSGMDCYKCSVEASKMIHGECPNAVGARVQLEHCFLRYEHYSFASQLDTDVIYALVNVKSSNDSAAFNKTLVSLVNHLSTEAPAKYGFATGSAVESSSEKIYGLEMCWKSLSEEDCSKCLSEGISAMFKCCSGRVGAQVYLGTCTVRYEIYPFFKDSYLH